MITVIADPLEGFIRHKFKFLNRHFVKTGGHRAVRESLLSGLELLGVKYNYNPYSFDQMYDKVIVISSPEALKQIVEYKRKFSKNISLAAGPNIVVSPDEDGGYLGYPEIDFCIVPSPWVMNFYIERLPVLNNRVITWPAGVNTDVWVPGIRNGNWDTNPSKKIVFYLKRPIKSDIVFYKEIAERHGWEVILLQYGQYSIPEYKSVLQEVKLLVHFVEQESQGISLLEAWAMNIPTLVWNPGYFHYKGKNYKSSSAPYMDDNCGSFFIDALSFESVLSSNKEYQPRKWVLENATIEISTIDLLNKLKWL